jgi:Tol biopolymer transport system component
MNRKLHRLVLPVVTILAVAPLLTTPARATYPGENGRIAFRRYFDADKQHGAVFTINPDGTGEVQVTHTKPGYVDQNPDVSPDGTRIAFQRSGPLSDEIWVVDADGSGLRRLTGSKVGCQPELGTCDGQPAWSPDGEFIAFSRASGRIVDDMVPRWSIMIMRKDGTHVRRVTQLTKPAQGEDSAPQWSPDGRYLVFERHNVRDAKPVAGVALWTIDLKKGTERRITPWRLRAGDTPDWSPDGRRILFHSNNQPKKDGISGNLYTIRPDGTGLKQLTFASGGVTQYLGSSYSPDGTMITFARRPATGGQDLDAADVFTMWVDGTHREHVTTTRKYDSFPDWGPAS